MPTLFEKIIAGELPAAIVHKDDRVTAFRDIRPVAPTHILIVPTKPIPTAKGVEFRRTLLRGMRQSEGQAGRLRARRSRRGREREVAQLLRPEALPHRRVRSARLWPQPPAREPRGKHDLAPGGRHGTTARAA